MAKSPANTLADWKEQDIMKIFEDRLDAKEDPLKILDDVRKAWNS